jgi:glutamate mutase epsilon subunit
VLPAALQFLDFPEPDRQQLQHWSCYAAHNAALNKARRAQAVCINELLACACGPELTRRLAKQLRHCPGVKHKAADAVLLKVKQASGTSGKGLQALDMGCSMSSL